MEVVLDHPETMNMLGLIMKMILERNLQDPDMAATASQTKGNLRLGAGPMKATLSFEGQRLVIKRDWETRSRAKCAASLDTFLRIGLGGNPVIPFLQGKVKIGGNIFWLLILMPLFQVHA